MPNGLKAFGPGLHTIADFGGGLREELPRARRSDVETRDCSAQNSWRILKLEADSRVNCHGTNCGCYDRNLNECADVGNERAYFQAHYECPRSANRETENYHSRKQKKKKKISHKTSPIMSMMRHCSKLMAGAVP